LAGHLFDVYTIVQDYDQQVLGIWERMSWHLLSPEQEPVIQKGIVVPQCIMRFFLCFEWILPYININTSITSPQIDRGNAVSLFLGPSQFLKASANHLPGQI
jgi:hypothetical protein